MTDTQIGLLIAAIGGVAAAVRWGVNRAARALDRNTDVTEKALDRNTDAMIANTKSNAELATKVDGIASFVHHTGHTPVAGVPIGIADPPQQQTTVPRTGRTPAGGYHIQRASSRGDNDR